MTKKQKLPISEKNRNLEDAKKDWLPLLQNLLTKQQEYTTYFFDRLDLKPIESLVHLLLECPGIIFLTGVGKSGLVAKKIAFTMVSTGTRAVYISPTDAVHGDLGMVSPKDIFILLSKSGESDELLNLIPAIRNKGAFLVAVVCNATSRLSTACQQTILLPFQQELCPFDMAPTMSTTFQVLFGDLITVALMHGKNFSLDEYALNHPSGRIGKRMTLKVQDLMLVGERIPLCHPNDLLSQVLVELSDKRCGCVLIVDTNQHLLGIFTDGDLRRMLQKQGSQVLEEPMHKMMTRHPMFIAPTALAWEALKVMEANYQKRMTVLPVLDKESKVLGILHLHDIIQSGL